MTWIQTADGYKFDLLQPDHLAIEPDTLARVLARKCRFGGHVKPGVEWYSVAQHSLLVCDLVPPDLKLAALLHDAHEAYWGFGDVLRPAKLIMRRDMRDFLENHERVIDHAVCERFGVNYQMMIHPKIKHADNVALATEARDVMAPPPEPWDELPEPYLGKIEPWGIDESYRRFSARLYELWSDE